MIPIPSLSLAHMTHVRFGAKGSKKSDTQQADAIKDALAQETTATEAVVAAGDETAPKKKGVSCCGCLLVGGAVALVGGVGGGYYGYTRIIKPAIQSGVKAMQGTAQDNAFEGQLPQARMMSSEGVALLYPEGIVRDGGFKKQIAHISTEGNKTFANIDFPLEFKKVGYGDRGGNIYATTQYMLEAMKGFYTELSGVKENGDGYIKIGEVSEEGFISDVFGRPVGRVKPFDGNELARQEIAALGLLVGDWDGDNN